MKILLLGDFSAVNINLKRGLENYGCQVLIASIGDGTGEFYRDIDLRSKFEIKKKTNRFNNYWNKLVNTIHCIKILNRLLGYDIVQFIHIDSFGNIFFPSLFRNIVIKNSRKSILYSCGTDLSMLQAIVSGKFKYSPFDNPADILNKMAKLSKSYFKFIENIDYIICASYTYYMGMKDYPNFFNIIPLPYYINKDPIIKECAFDRKIVIYYSPRRPEFKGAKFIIPALNRISVKYNERAEIIINNRLPFNKYIEEISKVDIIIDQCRGYDYGMNAIIAMAQGKVVLSGSEKEATDIYEVENCPIINIIPDEEQIYNILEYLINHPEKINELKYKSVEYVKQVHDANVIAKKFISVYNL